MLPGVELARRRRTNHHIFDSNSRESSHLHHHRLDSSTTMDETALKARKRLEDKLGSHRGSRPQMSNSNEGRIITRVGAVAQEAERGGNNGNRVIVAGRRFTQLERRNSHRDDVCSICLEEFGTSKQVMNLPCFHKYHSECLLPWLTSHSHCPNCRTHVHP